MAGGLGPPRRVARRRRAASRRGTATLEREAAALELAADVLHAVRKAKSDARLPMRAPVDAVRIVDVPQRIDALELAAGDISLAGSIEQIDGAG